MGALISVIVPFYNAERYLAEALESIVQQAGVRLEVIAVNDGSTDESPEIAKAAGPLVRCVEQRQQGTPAALNHGLAAAEGEYFSFLDADDRWVDNKLQWQYEKISAEPDLDFVLGQMQHFYSPELTAEERAEVQCPPDPIPGYCPGAMLIRRDSFEKVGPFSSEWRVGEFLDWFLKARESGLKFSCCDKPALLRRVHSSNKGRTHKQAREDYLRIIRESMRRKKMP